MRVFFKNYLISCDRSVVPKTTLSHVTGVSCPYHWIIASYSRVKLVYSC